MRPLQQIFESSGDEIIVYHGSRRKFDRFDDNKIKNALTAGWGHYFTESPTMATRWLDMKSGWLYKVRLNVTGQEVAYAFSMLGRQPHVLRAFQEITSGLNEKQDSRMFDGMHYGQERKIRYTLEEMSYNMAISRLAGALAGGWSKASHERKVAMLLKDHGIRAVCYHDLGAPNGVYNFNCFDSSRIEILSRTRA